ncbi:hypothetical protein OUZ56_000103 [Daphnia magna]|uniref:GMP synthase n=1 Tax=Daphnia magna TaxID=35525 RepID=A0ABQ9ZYQ6_9CRUS|nr:hypothetical protein OUZ56_000103 [Daphnia magna]
MGSELMTIQVSGKSRLESIKKPVTKAFPVVQCAVATCDVHKVYHGSESRKSDNKVAGCFLFPNLRKKSLETEFIYNVGKALSCFGGILP